MNEPKTAARPPLPLRLAIAPLHLLERTRGRKRAALVVLYLIVMAVVGLLAWRALSLRNLPDLGDPFDPDEFAALIVPDEENAFTYYKRAEAALKPSNTGAYPVSAPKAWDEPDWTKAEPSVRRWVEDNAEALGLWMRGSRLDSALLIDPRGQHIGSLLGPAQELRTFARLGRLEASRRLEEGDAEGAWEVLHGVLRATRHVERGGGAIQRMIGAALARFTSTAVQAWMADPRVGPDLLRGALADVRAAKALTPPYAEMVKVEYLSLRNTLSGPDAPPLMDSLRHETLDPVFFFPGGYEAITWLKREPERSLRVLRILYDAWIDQAERPPSARVAAFSRQAAPGIEYVDLYEFYPPGPKAGGMSPDALADWLDTTFYARMLWSPFGALAGAVHGDRMAFSVLEIALAEELFRREQGRDPKSIDELVGPYLERMPEGYEGLGGGP